MPVDLRLRHGTVTFVSPRFHSRAPLRARLSQRLAIAAWTVILLLVAGDVGRLAAQTAGSNVSSHHLSQGFKNLDPSYSYSMLDRASRMFRRLGQAAQPRGKPFALKANDGAELRANGARATATWIGHSTFLIQLEGINLLTDPHWGDRASPLSFAGPRRLIAPGLRFEDLPPIHAVVISHDHYDHLDPETVSRIARTHDALFVVPLGLRPVLFDLGAARVVELDWWESTVVGGLTIVCTPAQHSSGRTLTDQNRRLWSSWAVLGESKRFFFAGDTGYFAGFKEIGARLGPFELATVPIGGYSAYVSRHPNHVNPEEAVRLFEDVGGQILVPMHWGTFDMNMEPFAEPPERLLREARRRGLEARMKVLVPGETLHW
jgi:N-acyl-phosphatidylethanolamine-hydrolysing phospholipase D